MLLSNLMASGLDEQQFNTRTCDNHTHVTLTLRLVELVVVTHTSQSINAHVRWKRYGGRSQATRSCTKSVTAKYTTHDEKIGK